MKINSIKEKLDQTVLDIEFLLISVVQGVALVTLADNGADLISNLEFKYWIYIISAFLLILIFWSQAIIHAVSFIGWPMDLKHSLLYFLVSFIEVVAFHDMSDPLKWFGFTVVLFLIAFILYIVDSSIIKDKKSELVKTSTELYKNIIDQQLLELRVFLPLGFLYSLAAFVLIYTYPEIFIKNNLHIILIGIQAIFGVLFLVNSLISFKKRTKLISNGIKS